MAMLKFMMQPTFEVCFVHIYFYRDNAIAIRDHYDGFDSLSGD